MLNLYSGESSRNLKMINNIEDSFESLLDLEWFKDPLVKQIIQDIDKSEIREDGMLDSPVLGLVPYTWLSTSTKETPHNYCF